jgi:hypothetical protein
VPPLRCKVGLDRLRLASGHSRLMIHAKFNAR